MKFLSLSLPNPNLTGTITISPPAGVPTGGLENGGGGQQLIQIAIELIFIVGISLAVILIIISGIQMIVSGGDKQKVQAVRRRLTYSIIGLVIIVGAFFILNVVITLLGGNSLYFLNTRTAAEACHDTPVYTDCGGGRFICGVNDQSQCKTP